MTFKLKNKQRVIPSSRQTLDAKHQEMMQSFQKEKGALNNLYESLDNIQNELNTLNETNNNNMIINLDIQKKIWELEDKKNDIESKIKKIETSDDAIKYMLDTSRILHTYYNYINNECISSNNIMNNDVDNSNDSNISNNINSSITDSNNVIDLSINMIDKQNNKKKKNDSDINNKKHSKISPINSNLPIESKKVKSVLDFFMDDKSSVKTDMETGKKHINIVMNTKDNNEKNIDKTNDKTNDKINDKTNDNTNDNEKNIVEKNVKSIKRKISKEILYEKYMINIDNNYIRTLNSDLEMQDFCKQCNIELLLCQNSGIQICSSCGYSEIVIVDSDKPSYKDPPKEMTSFCYKRINHLNEFLAQFQAKETTEIPEDIYQDILMEIKKERITNMATITPEKMRDILRKIKRNDYYEHIPYIINQLNGNPAPVIAPEIEDVLRGMFKAIQIPFEKYCPDDRKNFLSYNYFMYKFFELLELDEYLNHFQLLKSRLKLYQHDQIWKNICSDLGWEFIPSL